MTLPFGLTPFAAKIIGGAVLLILAVAGFMLWLDGREKAAVANDRAKARVEAMERARRADEAALGEIRAVQDATKTSNEEARDAARNSDDPLRDGFGKLRERQARSRPPAR